jgi:hypothetical protein
MRTRPVWLLTFPFLLLAEIFGHTVVARTLGAGASRHRLLLHASGDFRAYAPAALAAVLMLAGAALVRRTLASFRAGPEALPAWRLAAVPPLLFLVQEHVERFAQEGRAGWLTSVEPVVLAGVLVELACGLFAVWLVRGLLRAADRLGCALARLAANGARRPRAVRPRHAIEATPLRLPVLALRQAGRAPPAPALRAATPWP